MRPKRPARPPEPPPRIPAVVTPESLDAINTPEVDKIPAYISVGKFQWKPPLPGPKGDPGEPGAPGEPGEPGEPGAPGATVRPITPPVSTDEIANGAVTPEKLSFSVPSRPLTPPITTDEIGDGQVTQAKLAPDVQTGDRHVFGTVLTPGLQSAEVLYLTGQAASIPWTTLDISTYVPEGAKAILCQLGIYTESTVPNSRAELRIRTNVDQRDALGVSNKGTNQSDYNGGVVPLVTSGARTIEYSMDVTGTISVTMWITVVGYIV